MGGHLDDGEPDQEHPIFSYSFGLSCIFLIGGISKDDQPFAIILESGDLCIMSGFSRKCYHGVPKVIAGSFKISNQSDYQNISEDKLKEINNAVSYTHLTLPTTPYV